MEDYTPRDLEDWVPEHDEEEEYPRGGDDEQY